MNPALAHILRYKKPPVAVPPAGYMGPGDVRAITQFASPAFAVSAAYAVGNGAGVDLVDQAEGNQITINFLANGRLDVASVAAWGAAHSVTRIYCKKLYEQVSGNHFIGTTGVYPEFVLNKINGNPILRLRADQGSWLRSTSDFSLPDPTTWQVLLMRDDDAGFNYSVDGPVVSHYVGLHNLHYPENLRNTLRLSGFGGTDIVTTPTNDVPHIVQAILTNTDGNGNLNIDGTNNLGSPHIFNDQLNKMEIGTQNATGSSSHRYLAELAVMASLGAYHAGLYANAKSRWGI